MTDQQPASARALPTAARAARNASRRSRMSSAKLARPSAAGSGTVTCDHAGSLGAWPFGTIGPAAKNLVAADVRCRSYGRRVS